MVYVESAEAEVALISRLASDANILLEAERYESGLILLVIAVENIGKLLVHVWEMPGANNHTRKQRAAASLAMVMLFHDGMTAAGLEIKRETDLSPEQKVHFDQVRETKESKSQWDDYVRLKMLNGLEEWPHKQVFEAIQSGWIYGARNNAIYGNNAADFPDEEIRNAAIALSGMCQKVLPWLEDLKPG